MATASIWHNEHANQPNRMRCDECLRALPINLPGHVGGAGYGMSADGSTVRCYACCAKHDKAQMLADGEIVLYLTRDLDRCWQVSNWPGSLTFPAHDVRAMRHPFAKARIGYFTGPDGKRWSAKNIGDSDIARCKRLAR